MYCKYNHKYVINNCYIVKIALLLIQRGGTMITIFLCDDDPEIREKYAKLIQSIAEKHNLYISITAFESAEELFFMLDDIKVLPDIIYLDIQMGEMNGLDAAAKLRSLGIQAEIIFLSNLKEYVFESFDVMPANYLLKYAITDERFESVLMKSIENVSITRDQLFMYEIKGMSYTLVISDIIYIEVKKRIIAIKTRQEQIIEFYSTMTEVEQQILGSPLVRVQRSFIVNMTYIKTFGKSEIVLLDGSVVPVGRTYQNALENSFVDFINR